MLTYLKDSIGSSRWSLDAGTLSDDVLVTPLVDHTGAHLTLIRLVPEAPDEVVT